jgi:hypothetical protein
MRRLKSLANYKTLYLILPSLKNVLQRRFQNNNERRKKNPTPKTLRCLSDGTTATPPTRR